MSNFEDTIRDLNARGEEVFALREAAQDLPAGDDGPGDEAFAAWDQASDELGQAIADANSEHGTDRVQRALSDHARDAVSPIVW